MISLREMVILAVTLQGTLWHSLIELPARTAVEIHEIFLLKQFFLPKHVSQIE